MRAVIINTTAGSEEPLNRIAEALIVNQLAACCQISGPVRSIYRWKGNVESATEYCCSIKTTSLLASAVADWIRSLHPYDEPEIVVTEIVGGSDSYIQWIMNSVKSESGN